MAKDNSSRDAGGALIDAKGTGLGTRRDKVQKQVPFGFSQGRLSTPVAAATTLRSG
jgi:hypothetical protein